MRVVILFLMVVSLWAENIEITSDSFEASQKELISKFIGNVLFQTSKERLRAQKVFIYFDKNRKPIKVVATGEVRFDIKDREGKSYKGSAQQVIFYPKKREYVLLGSVHVVQNPGAKKIYASQIYIDLKNSKLLVKGKEKKPVKMIFTIEEK